MSETGDAFDRYFAIKKFPQYPTSSDIMTKLEVQEHMVILLLKKLTRIEARVEALTRIEERLAALELKDF